LYFEPLGAWLEPFLLGAGFASRIIAFILIFTVINRLAGLVFWLVNKIFNIISFIPFTKTINRVLGAVLGLIEAALVLGVILAFIMQFPFVNLVTQWMENSAVSDWLINVGNFILPFVPGLIEKVHAFVSSYAF